MDAHLSQVMFGMLYKPELRTVAMILVSAGANPTIENLNQNRALTEAVICEEYELVKLLIKQGADVNEKRWNGSTPLFNAVQGESNIVKVLIENGADVNVRDTNLTTPLMCVTTIENFNILLAEGADPSATNTFQQSCIQSASQYGKLKIVKALVNLGMSVESKNYRGDTCLFIAVSYGHVELVRYLLGVGAKINESILREVNVMRHNNPRVYEEIERILLHH